MPEPKEIRAAWHATHRDKDVQLVFNADESSIKYNLTEAQARGLRDQLDDILPDTEDA